MTHCELQKRGKRLVCPNCDQPKLPTSLVLPIYRECSAASASPILNQLVATGPCLHAGEPAGLVECQTCAGKVQIKTFACGSADVPQPRAAWSDKSLPDDVAKCGGCRWYEPREKA